MSQTLEQSKNSGREEESASLFAPGAAVRVSDLVGDLHAAESRVLAQPERSFVLSKPSVAQVPANSPAARFGGLKLDWYDWSVALLIVASLVAGIVCLLSGK